MTSAENLELLKRTERTRYWKCWHDHSDILNHPYVNFMVSCIYDPAVYLSNEEYQLKFPNRKQDIQTIVEKPYLYILGQSGSSDIDQLTYSDTRVEDLKEMHKCITATSMNAPFQDVFRMFSGDNPARQFESGQQRGGHYSCLCGVHVENHQNFECCFRRYPRSLQQRTEKLRNGVQWKNFHPVTNPNPFSNLRVQQIQDELDARRIEITDTRKAAVLKQLTDELEGIQRPPALLCSMSEGQNTIKDLHLETYEVQMCEPLHDISNVVANLITELPYHLPEREIQKEYEEFSKITIGDKNQIRGSDARLYAVKLSKFTQTKYEEGKVDINIVNLCNSLIEIISIAYSKADARNARQILRMYNQSFIFGQLCKSVIGNPVKMTSRKFYGTHFHSLVTHAPEAYRLFCLKSILTENEERSFGSLRSISKNTSDRKPCHIIQNAIIRYNAQQHSSEKQNSFLQQDSFISKQSKLLPPRGPSVFQKSFICSRTGLFQSHLERIADYMMLGENFWWSQDETSVTFHDSAQHPVHSDPKVLHFRNVTAIDVYEHLKECWDKCTQEFIKSSLQLPIKRVKVFQNGKCLQVFHSARGKFLFISIHKTKLALFS